MSFDFSDDFDVAQFYSDDDFRTRADAKSAAGHVALSAKAGDVWRVLHGVQDVLPSAWRTVFVGRVFLHAGAVYPHKFWAEDFRRALDTSKEAADAFPTPQQFAGLLGCVCGCVDIVGCGCAASAASSGAAASVWRRKGAGKPFVFRVANPIVFDAPVPLRGRPGFFKLVAASGDVFAALESRS